MVNIRNGKKCLIIAIFFSVFSLVAWLAVNYIIPTFYIDFQFLIPIVGFALILRLFFKQARIKITQQAIIGIGIGVVNLLWFTVLIFAFARNNTVIYNPTYCDFVGGCSSRAFLTRSDVIKGNIRTGNMKVCKKISTVGEGHKSIEYRMRMECYVAVARNASDCKKIKDKNYSKHCILGLTNY